jgi:hypothetical protein
LILADTMASRPLYVPHTRALKVLHADLESHAVLGTPAFPGTAGSVIERRNASGFRFYAHQYYDGEGRKRERYLAGPVGDRAADQAAAATRARIREIKDLVPSLRLLGREGYNLADPRTYGTLASLANHGLFAAGAVLVGSHAYGVLLNRLGARATPYATEDIDIARGEALAFDPQPPEGFLEMLRDSGIDFIEVPRLDRAAPSTSFKQRGRSHFHVDLLVPSQNETVPAVAVPELKAHATGLPFLQYLLAESQTGLLLAREGLCAVRLPLPERFAIHKLVVSRLRVERGAKSDNDVHQASVLAAVLGETHPDALASAVEALPRRARKHLEAGLLQAAQHLEAAHPRAWGELRAA